MLYLEVVFVYVHSHDSLISVTLIYSIIHPPICFYCSCFISFSNKCTHSNLEKNNFQEIYPNYLNITGKLYCVDKSYSRLRRLKETIRHYLPEHYRQEQHVETFHGSGIDFCEQMKDVKLMDKVSIFGKKNSQSPRGRW